MVAMQIKCLVMQITDWILLVLRMGRFIYLMDYYEIASKLTFI